MNVRFKKSHLLLLLNQTFVLLYLCYEYIRDIDIITSNVMLILISTITINILSYLKIINLNNNGVLSQFSDLLLFFSWQILIIDSSNIFYYLEITINVLVLYKLFQFILIFIFQNSVYKNKRNIEFVLKLTAIITLISVFNKDIYSVTYFLQWIINISLLILAILRNKKRVLFFLKNGYQNLVRSFVITIIPYSAYIFFFNEGENIFTNLAFYLILIFPLYSIYLMVRKNKKKIKKEEQLNSKNKIILCVITVVFMLFIGNLLDVDLINYFIIVHSILWFNILYFILVYSQVKNSMLNGTEKQQYDSYINSIVQISREEQLKKDFSNYLHDEILQDILAVKNIINKADKVEIKKMIVETLNELSRSIRRQTEEYHPTILRTLTLKENYSNLIENIKQTFGKKQIHTSFICEEDIFLLEPYNLIVYRFIKELTTNSFKHSQGNRLWIQLNQEMEEVELIVEDNGEGKIELDKIKKGHKGLTSIKEQVHMLGGKMEISSRTPSGLKVRIYFSMKGDYSYEHFINR